MTNYLAVNSSFYRNSVNKSFVMFVHGDPKRHGSSFSFFCRLTWGKEAGKHVTTLVWNSKCIIDGTVLCLCFKTFHQIILNCSDNGFMLLLKHGQLQYSSLALSLSLDDTVQRILTCTDGKRTFCTIVDAVGISGYIQCKLLMCKGRWHLAQCWFHLQAFSQ